MLLQISTSELNKLTSFELVPLKCKFCDKIFYKTKKYIVAFGLSGKRSLNSCSISCHNKSKSKKIKSICTNCNTEIIRSPNEFKKSINHFCSHSCSAHFNNNKIQHTKTLKVCLNCSNEFNPHNKNTKFCSRNCNFIYKNKTNKIDIVCSQCSKIISRNKTTLRSDKHFCNKSCRMIYNNTHNKKLINRNNRSKLEMFIENYLKNMTTLNCLFNDRTTISPYELDLYFPDQKLGIELNGIHHFKPIHGVDNLNKHIEKDNKKQELCRIKNIKLYTFNVSKDGNFTNKIGEHYISEILKLVTPEGFKPTYDCV